MGKTLPILKKAIFALIAADILLLSVYNAVFDYLWSFAFVLIAFATFLLFLIYTSINKKVVRIPYSLVMFILVLAVSIIFSFYRFTTLLNVYIIVSATLFYIIVTNTASNAEEYFLLLVILWVGVFEATIGFLAYFLNVLVPSNVLSIYFASHAFISGTRVSSFFQYPNSLAGFLLMPFFVSLYVLSGQKTLAKRLTFTFISAFILFVFYLAGSRGGYIIFAISLVLFLLFYKRLGRKDFTNLLMVVILSLIFYFTNYKLFYPSISENISRIKVMLGFFAGERNKSLSDRIQLAKDALNIFLHHPIFGTGLGTFKDAMLKYRIGLFFAREPHSMPFRLLAETGIIGFLAAFYFYVENLLRGLKKNPYLYVAVSAIFLHTFLDLDFAYPLVISATFIGFAFMFNPDSSRSVKLAFNYNVVLSLIVISLIVLSILPGFLSAMYYNGGNSLLNSNEFNRAISSFSMANYLQKNNAEIHAKTALCFEELAYANAGRCDTYLKHSISEYQEASKCNKLSFIYPLYAGNLYLLFKDKNSIGLLEESYNLNPLWKPVLADLALAYAYTGDDDKKAIPLAREALAFNARRNVYNALHYTTPAKKDSTSYTALGFASKSINSINYFNEAIKLDPDNGFAYLGKALLEKGILSVENLRRAVNVSSCILDAREKYFKNAPLIKVKNIEFLDNGKVFVSVDIVQNSYLLSEIQIYVVQEEKSVKVASFNSKEGNLVFHLPAWLKGKYRIKIKGIDLNGMPLSATVSPEFDRK